MQPLRVPPDTGLIAVVRIESRGSIAGVDSQAVASQILSSVHVSQIRAVQIDFDARVSERAFYRSLIRVVRSRLPREMPLEITALASWCTTDDWLRGLPIADAVLMFFRMGVDPHRPVERMREPSCRSSIGISTDEVYTEIPRGRRMFVFHPSAWTEADYRAVLQESRKWR